MHTVIAADCSGCELCVPACPVDCIHMVPAPGLPAEPLPPAAVAERARALPRGSTNRAVERLSRTPWRLAAPLAQGESGRAAAARAGAARTRPRSGCCSSACAPRTRARAASSPTRSPYQLLVSVILSAQATDRSVNLATEAAVSRRADAGRRWPRSARRGLAGYIRTIGLWRMKAKNVIAATRMILERHGGEVPRERAALEALPGVGRKTANVVMNTAFGEPTIAVDTHIFRVVEPHRPRAGTQRARGRGPPRRGRRRTSSGRTRTTG